MTLCVPPLRERKEDLLPLAEHFIGEFTKQLGTAPVSLDREQIARLMHHDWPGNVRELKNLMERFVLFGVFPDNAFRRPLGR